MARTFGGVSGHWRRTGFRAFINSELGLPEVAPWMARTESFSLVEFLDIGAEPAQSHTPPKYGARNSHISHPAPILTSIEGLLTASEEFVQKH